jgi:hypothetical protein
MARAMSVTSGLKVQEQHRRDERQAQQEHREGVDHPGGVIHQEAAGFRIDRAEEQLLPVVDHDGVARTPRRRRDAGDRAAVGDREQDDGGQVVHLLRVGRGQRDEAHPHRQHHRGHRVLADEGRDHAAHGGDAEGHPVGVGAGEAHDQPGDALVELLLDDGHRQHQRAHDEQHRIRHQALGDVGRVELEQQHLADDDEQRHRGQRHRLGDEQQRRHQRHRQHDLAFVG